MQPWLHSQWGNPSSIHAHGRMARKAIEDARAKVAQLVGARTEQVIFTSGATEANNAAIHSALLSNPEKKHIITSQVEHSSVLAYCDHLEHYHGIEITRLPVDENGTLSSESLRKSIREDTAIVSLMWANNETGVIWPIAEFAKICSDRGKGFHTDAVQAVGKIEVNFTACGASFLSLSGHKFGAPKGIGALLIAQPCTFIPMIFGGKQENDHRGGTENVPHIVALGCAAEASYSHGLDRWEKVAALRNAFEQTILARVERSQINGKGEVRLPNTSNIHFPGIDADALVTFLDQQGICVSSGSACLESAITPSHVIYAMTDSHDRASESVRISLGHATSDIELQKLHESLQTFANLNA